MNYVRFELKAAQGLIFRINLAWPQCVPPAKGWPVSYVLDQNEFWTALSVTQDQAAPYVLRGDAEGVVVGIGVSTPAQRQYVYTPLIDPNYSATLQPEGSGGYALLAEALVGELLPMVEQMLPINPSKRTLCGHSLAGLFVSHHMLTDVIRFNRYIISSPSVWWADFYLLVHASQCLSARRVRMQSEVYLTVGQYEQGASPRDLSLPLEAQQCNEQRRQQRKMVTGAEQLARILRTYPCFTVHFGVIDDADHGSASTVAWQRAFR